MTRPFSIAFKQKMVERLTGRAAALHQIREPQKSRSRATHDRIDRSRWYGARLTSASSLPRSDDQVVARNSSRSTRRSVASSGSFLRLACSRNAALIRLW
jgi:hypothetical protein